MKRTYVQYSKPLTCSLTLLYLPNTTYPPINAAANECNCIFSDCNHDIRFVSDLYRKTNIAKFFEWVKVASHIPLAISCTLQKDFIKKEIIKKYKMYNSCLYRSSGYKTPTYPERGPVIQCQIRFLFLCTKFLFLFQQQPKSIFLFKNLPCSVSLFLFFSMNEKNLSQK